MAKYAVKFDYTHTEVIRYSVESDSPESARLEIQRLFDSGEINGEMIDRNITGDFDWDSLEPA